MTFPEVVSRTEWQQARDALLVKEKAVTRTLDALAAERRRLPVAPFTNEHVFKGPDGDVTLLELFDGRRQLIVYQFMDSGPDAYCPGCCSFADNMPQLEHLWARDTSFVCISNMPLEQTAGLWKRFGWHMPFYSSRGTTFSYDHGAKDRFALSAFIRDDQDQIYQSYTTTERGCDMMRFDFNLLDITPYGRQETWEDSPAGWPQSPPYEWWRLRDEY